jgi:hypothetical protein
MLSGVWAGHQHGPEQLVKSRALEIQLLMGVSGRGLVSQPVSKIVVHPMGMLVEISSDMPKTSFSSSFLARLFTGFRPFFFMSDLLLSQVYVCICVSDDLAE